MSGPTTYRGNCHCGAFVYEVTVKEPITAYQECNCSICVKKGYAYLPMAVDKEFKVVKGSMDDLSSYVFNQGRMAHKFCPTCASPLMVVPVDPGLAASPGLNIRCLQGPVDLRKLEKNTFDGLAWKPDYKTPPFTGTEPTGGPEDAKVYYGSCHCGAVRLAFRNKPLEKLDRAVDGDDVVDCNCSICIRNGYVWIYPNADQVALEGTENLGHYEFNRYLNSKTFCKICGVPMTNPTTKYTDEELAKLPPAARSEAVIARRKKLVDRVPVNLRVLDVASPQMLAALPIHVLDGYNTMKPEYVNP